MIYSVVAHKSTRLGSSGASSTHVVLQKRNPSDVGGTTHAWLAPHSVCAASRVKVEVITGPRIDQGL